MFESYMYIYIYMTEPTRTSTGIAYLTYDATLNTDASMIIQQKLDLSGNTTAQTFCENAFDLAAGEDISGALLTDSDITDYSTNNLVYLGSNDLNVQKTFLSANENSTKAQLIALNAYEMTLGKNNQIPLVSKLGIIPPPILLCLTENSQMNIVNSQGNKYVLNGETEYSSRKVYGLHNGTDTRTYTITNIPVEHPLAILNTGNSNISYSFERLN